MIDLIDFNQAERLPIYAYGGNAGLKYAVLFKDRKWLLKFPEHTRSFESVLRNPDASIPSYTNSPLSEYIGSRIYESLGIDVHRTLLGIRDGKVVCACLDFLRNDDSVLEFQEYRQTKSSIDGEYFQLDNGSHSNGEYLSDVFNVIEHSESIAKIKQQVIDRFWDMFVVDAFILNNDRNNGNWGFLIKDSGLALAPVFDNGQAFFNKKKLSKMEAALDNPDTVWSNVNSSKSFFLKENGHHIKPYELLRSTQNPDCLFALERFVNNLDMNRVEKIITHIPTIAGDVVVMPDVTKQFYLQAASASLYRGILPAAEQQGIEIPDRLLAFAKERSIDLSWLHTAARNCQEPSFEKNNPYSE